MGYEDLDRLLESAAIGPGCALWQRRLVLGPAPELCLAAREAVALPPPLVAETITSTPVWPTAR
jgi:hypothetical protein